MRYRWLVCVLTLLISPGLAAGLAFPTAEGFGANAEGGRGGAVYKVNQLGDSGPGSLRECAQATGRRTCVFTVSGTIVLNSSIDITQDAQSYLTIAGQTAPNSGIQVRSAPGVSAALKIRGDVHDVIIRHLKWRPGIEGITAFDNNNTFAYEIGGGRFTTVRNIILDHVEGSWAGYINLDFYGGVRDTTVQWSVFTGGDGKDHCCGIPAYSYGTISTAYVNTLHAQTISLHHNLFVDHEGRVPQFSGFEGQGNVAATFDFRNNYIYDWYNCNTGVFGGAGGPSLDGPFDAHVNFVGNKYVMNPTAPPGIANCEFQILGGSGGSTDTGIYVQDNSTPYCAGSPNCPADAWDHRFIDDVTKSSVPEATEGRFRRYTPFATPPVVTHSAAALENVLLNGTTGAIGTGPRRPVIDAYLAKTFNEVVNKTGTRGQDAGWPNLTTGGVAYPTDSDGDGIPNSYETGTLGTNPNNGADGANIGPSGYSNLELYLNALAGDGAPVAPADPIIYYLDVASIGGTCSPANNGTSLTTPKCTFADVQPLLAAGDSVFFRAGTYPGIRTDTTPGFASGTSPTSMITFSAYQNEVVTLVPNGENVMYLYAYGGVSPTQLRYLRFNKLILDGQHTAGVNDVLGIFGSISDIHFSHVTIRNAVMRGIHGGAATDLHFANMTIHNNGVGQAQGHGVFLAAPRSIIEHSEIFGNGGFGIRVYHPGCGETLTTDPTCSDNMVIQKNRIYNHTAAGGGGLSLNHGKLLRAANNLIYGNGVGVQLAENSLGIEVFHNTIYGNTTGIEIRGGTIQGATNAQIKSNLLTTNGTALALVSSPVGVTQTNNELADPLYLAPTATPPNFQVAPGSPATNKVALVGGVCLTPTDFAGTVRPEGTGATPCDIGAYEFVQGASPGGNDMYLSAGDHGDAPSDGAGDIASCIAAENPATPKATWASACQCLSATPGKRLLVRGGIYTTVMDTLACPLAAGTASAPTTIEAYGAEVPEFRLPSGQTVLLWLRGVNDSHLKFKGLTLDAMNRANSNVVQIAAPGNNITFENVILRNASASCGFLADVSQIRFVSDPTLTTTRGRVQTCTLDGLKTGGTVNQLSVEGIEISAVGEKGINAAATSGTVNNLLVDRLDIHHTGTGAGAHAAIEIGPGSGAAVQNSLLYRNQVGVRVRSGASSVRVDHNTAANNSGVGLQCDAGAAVQFRSNVVNMNGVAGITTNCTGSVTTLYPNWLTDPAFTLPASDVYTLLPTSTAINTVPTLSEVTTSYVPGVGRPQGLASDPGAYEQDVPLSPTDPLTERRVRVHTPSFFQ